MIEQWQSDERACSVSGSSLSVNICVCYLFSVKLLSFNIQGKSILDGRCFCWSNSFSEEIFVNLTSRTAVLSTESLRSQLLSPQCCVTKMDEVILVVLPLFWFSSIKNSMWHLLHAGCIVSQANLTWLSLKRKT